MALARTGFIPVPPGPRPGFDHADVYTGGGARRLYVAHTGADRVDVIDCTAGTYLRSLPGHPGVAGVLADSRQDLLFTSDRAAAQVSVYRCSDEQLLARVPTGAHPNGLAFDPARGRLFAFNLGEPAGQNCTASVIDLDRPRVISTITLPHSCRTAPVPPSTPIADRTTGPTTSPLPGHDDRAEGTGWLGPSAPGAPPVARQPAVQRLRRAGQHPGQDRRNGTERLPRRTARR